MCFYTFNLRAKSLLKTVPAERLTKTYRPVKISDILPHAPVKISDIFTGRSDDFDKFDYICTVKKAIAYGT